MKSVIITGRVVRGAGYGKELGFPTANLDRRGYSHLKKKPRIGIYAGRAFLPNDHTGYQAAIVIGPLDQKGLPKIEAHLLHFKGAIYGKRISLTLGAYLRSFKNFRTVAELKSQIRADLRATRRIGNRTTRPLPRR